MRILFFEFITGGGFAGESLPESLAAEGAMMLQALAAELKHLPHIQPVIMLDWRCKQINVTPLAEIIVVEKGQDVFQILREIIINCDVCWPIAPEMDSILLDIAELAENLHKRTLISSREAIKLCSNKLATINHLQNQYVNVCETLSLSDAGSFFKQKSVIKPIDGVGCQQSVIISDRNDFQAVVSGLNDPEQFILQPYLEGRSLSLSCLFRHGKAWLLSCNEQLLSIEKGQFHLQACRVNIEHFSHDKYQKIVAKVAAAIPGLWGYIGIDIIDSTELGTVILEINPRLTTSYVGIHSATGINVAEQVLLLLESEPVITRKHNKQINVTISKGYFNAT